MTQKEYIKFLDKRKQLAVDRFGNLTQLERSIVNGSFDWIVNNLDTKGGKVVITADLDVLMNDFVNSVLKIINNNKEFQTKFQNYLSDISVIGKNLKEFHSGTNKLDLSKAGLTEVQKGVTNLIIDEFIGAGLNTNFAQPLKDIISRNAIAGMSLTEAKGFLNEYVLSGKDQSGKLGSYLTQTAQQGVDSYTGAINTNLADTFDFAGYIISGSLIKTSSKQCRYAVEHANGLGFLKNEDWKKILIMAKENKAAKLPEGTTLKNLPIRKLHWGCRHEFTPVL